MLIDLPDALIQKILDMDESGESPGPELIQELATEIMWQDKKRKQELEDHIETLVGSIS